MINSSPDPNNANPLAAFAGLVGVLTIFLFFTGWVYRWAYFSFFAIELTSLNFPAESFLLVPIQVILGDFGKLCGSILAALGVVGLIKITLWLVRKLRWFTNFGDLRRDVVIVSWVLIVLFWLARHQGIEDAWRDAVNKSSLRPIVTLISPSDRFALGADLNDELASDPRKNPSYPALKNLRIFGDVDQFRKLYAKGINRSDSSPQIVWRLLIESGNWIYLFPALSERKNELDRPPILAVHTADERVQSLILSRPQVKP